MARRPEKSAPKRPPTHDHQPPVKQLQVSADRMIARLQQQRADLEATVDILQIAYDEQLEQNAQLVQKLAEYEDTEKKDEADGGS